jgi:hypothetical protein
VALGKWTQQYVGVMGSVIHAGELRIGLRNLVLEDVDYARPALDKVEVWVDASDSGALVERLRGLGVLGDSGDSAAPDYRQSAPAASTAWPVELVPAPSAGYKTMAILFATMTAMGGVAALLDAFTGIVPVAGVMIVLAIGLFFTIKSARERATTLRLGFEDDRIALEDARRGTRLASCAVKDLVATPGHTIVQGRGTYTYMTLELTIGAHEPLRIGPADPTHSWKIETPKTRGAAYYVGPPEWKKLLEAIGLAQRAVFGI